MFLVNASSQLGSILKQHAVQACIYGNSACLKLIYIVNVYQNSELV